MKIGKNKKEKIINISKKIFSLSRQLMFKDSNLLNRYNLNRAHVEFFYLLKDRKNLKISNVAREMGTTNSSATQMIKCLESKGYIRKYADEKDLRLTYIAFTQQGRTFFNRFELEHFKILTLQFNQINNIDLEKIEKSLELIK